MAMLAISHKQATGFFCYSYKALSMESDVHRKWAHPAFDRSFEV